MKNLYRVVLLLVILPAHTLYGQLNVWRSQNPPTVSGTLNAVQIIDPSRIYVVGDQASFLVSVDSGNNWQAHSSIVPIKNFNCYGLSFIDSLTGMVVGKSGAIKTTDAGNSWKIMTTPGATKTFYGVLMLNNTIAFMVGPNNTIIKSTDAGNNWTPYGLELQVGTLKSIRKVRSDFLVITGENGFIVTSVDTGKIWSQVSTNHGNNINSVAFTGDSVAIGVGENGYITSTTDHGVNWTNHPLVDTTITVTASLNVIASKDPRRFIVVGDFSTTLYTTDGGLTWQKPYLGLGANVNLKGLDLYSPLYGIAVGEQGIIMRTVDGGANWQFLPNSPFYNTLYAIAFAKGDTLNGISVGQFGALLTTSNGGKKWTSQKPFTFSSLRSVVFSDSLTAYIVGDNGLMFKSSDRGLSWTQQAIPTKVNLRSISFPSSSAGFVAGDSATVLETSTAGASWHRLKTGLADTEVCYGISFINPKNGMIASGIDLEFTTDGGLSWSKKDMLAANGCVMITPTHYCYVSYDVPTTKGTITTSINGITNTVFGYDRAMQSVAFCDANRGTAVGYGGQIYHTTDGGTTWSSQVSNTSGVLYAVAYPSISATSTCGIRGTILRLTSDEIPLDGVRERPLASRNTEIEIVATFPNPATQFTDVSFSLARAMPLSIGVYDIRGAKVWSADLGIVSSGLHSETISLNGLANGAYILELRSASEANTINLRIDK